MRALPAALALLVAAPALAQPRPRPLRCPTGMALIPAGEFTLGSTAGAGDPDERPARRLPSAAFCLDLTEVTVGAYRVCAARHRCTAPVARAADGWRCNWTRPDTDAHPVNCVDWNQARAFCAWRGARLPTEAEWEYAARGREGRIHPWGSEAPDGTRANLCGPGCPSATAGGRAWTPIQGWVDAWSFTAPVGSFPAGRTPEGVLDLAGNVWEMTLDGYATDAARAVGPTAQHAVRVEGDDRVIRGGAWDSNDPAMARGANRALTGTRVRHHSYGFRCAGGPPAVVPPVRPRDRSLDWIRETD